MRNTKVILALLGLPIGLALLAYNGAAQDKRQGSVVAPAFPALEPRPAPPPPPPRSPESEGVDTLLLRLAGLKEEKAKLEAREKELVATLRKKLKEQKQKLTELGVKEDDEPPRVENSATSAN
jgi:hypothetical protein